MSEYAFADIITGKDILTDQVKDEDIIGTKGYFAGDLKTIVDSFDDNTFPDSLLEGTLETVSYIGRFRRKEDGIYFDYFIRKKEPPYQERQAEWVRQNDIHAGSWVKILRAFSSEEQRCDICYGGASMDCLVGKTVEVMRIDDECICIWDENHEGWWCWPYFVLEKAEKPEPEYLPFDLSKEEDRDALRGRWIRSTSGEYQISGFHSCDGEDGEEWMVAITTGYLTSDILYVLWRFDDGSRVGKPANGQQIK